MSIIKGKGNGVPVLINKHHAMKTIGKVDV